MRRLVEERTNFFTSSQNRADRKRLQPTFVSPGIVSQPLLVLLLVAFTENETPAQ